MGEREQFLYIPVIDGEAREDRATIVEVAEPDGVAKDLADDLVELYQLGIIEFLGAPYDPETPVVITGKGWAVCDALDRGEDETAAAIMRGDVTPYLV